MVTYSKDAILGFHEYIYMISPTGKEKRIKARIDTGATKSSIDINLAAQLNLGPVVGIRKVRNSMGESNRPIIKASVRINGRRIRASFTINDRSGLNYPVLIGQNILRMGFVVDPQKGKHAAATKLISAGKSAGRPARSMKKTSGRVSSSSSIASRKPSRK